MLENLIVITVAAVCIAVLFGISLVVTYVARS